MSSVYGKVVFITGGAAGVGAEVVEYRPDLAMLVITYLQGQSLEDASFADPGVLERTADACLGTGLDDAENSRKDRQNGWLCSDEPWVDHAPVAIWFPERCRDHDGRRRTQTAT